VNQELKRRSRVVRIFPNPASALRLATALLKEWHEDWVTGRRYLCMQPLEASETIERVAA
jgi:putative transposase